MKKIAEEIWQIISDSQRYSFNACVSGDTHILKSGLTKRFDPSVEEMYKIKNDIEYAKQMGHINLYKKYKLKGYGSALSMCEDGRIRKNKIVDIYYSGYQEVFKVLTHNSADIVCTNNHKFPTPLGEKRLDELECGDLLYVRGEYKKYNNPPIKDCIISIEPMGLQHVYDIEMMAPNHNFISQSGLITSNSHSLSVALDSLYGAYLKSTYPYEFYETYLRVMEENGKKDKMNAAKQEASEAFKIKFLPFRFGQDNRQITANEQDGTITDSIQSLKGFSFRTSCALYNLKNMSFNSFVDLLTYIEEEVKDINSSHIKTLISLDYFIQFGRQKNFKRYIGNSH